MEHLKRFLECSICLEQYEDPKLLNCGHHFCKECIEDILTFRKDGSGLITCPLRCENTTTIKKMETVNDLVTSYDFKNIIETFQKEDGDPQPAFNRCQNDKKCIKQVSVYCCKALMCKTCHLAHKQSDGHSPNSDRNVAFSHRENKFQFTCTEHRCGCTHVCADGTLLCKYCLYRDKEHHGHDRKTIDEEVRLIREALQNELDKIELFTAFGVKTKENIASLQLKISELLELRKRETRLLDESIEEDQIVDLDEEMNKLSEYFTTICDRHKQMFDIAFPTDSYETFLEGNELELILQKQNILDTLCSRHVPTILKPEFVLFTVGLGDSPLGTFSVSSCDEIDLSKNPEPTATLLTDGSESQQIIYAKKRIKDLMRAKRKVGKSKPNETVATATSLDLVPALPRKKKGIDRKRESSELSFSTNNPALVKLSLTMNDSIEGAWFKKGSSKGTKGTLYMSDGINTKLILTPVEMVLFYDHPSRHLGRRCVRCDKSISTTVDLYRFTIGDTPGREFLCYLNRSCGHFLPINDRIDTICWHYTLYFQKKTWSEFFQVFIPVVFHCVKSILRIILINLLDLICRLLDPCILICFTVGFIIYLYVLEYFKFRDVFNACVKFWIPDMYESGTCGCQGPIHLPIDNEENHF